MLKLHFTFAHSNMFVGRHMIYAWMMASSTVVSVEGVQTSPSGRWALRPQVNAMLDGYRGGGPARSGVRAGKAVLSGAGGECGEAGGDSRALVDMPDTTPQVCCPCDSAAQSCRQRL